MVATFNGRVVRARAVHPRPDTVNITKEAFANIKVGPWSPSEILTQGSGARPSPMTEETQPSLSDEPVPRSFRITQELLGRFDYTKGCPKCEAVRRGDEHRIVHHSRECRKRLEKEMTEDDLLSNKVAEVEGWQNKYFARQVESADQRDTETRESVSRLGVGPEDLATESAATHSKGECRHTLGRECRNALTRIVPIRVLLFRCGSRFEGISKIYNNAATTEHGRITKSRKQDTGKRI